MLNKSRTTPPWPSLYNLGLEIIHIEHSPPIQAGGSYLYHANDIFRFTLYWILLFYTPFFLLCGSYAFWNFAFPPSPIPFSPDPSDSYELRSRRPPLVSSDVEFIPPPKPRKINERRSRVAFALIVLLTFLFLTLAGAVIGSAVIGFVIAGLYKAGDYNMSTWIPCLLAVAHVLIGLLSIWPSIIDII